MSVGSQTTHAMTRANLAAAEDAKRKLQEIAATRSRRHARADYVLGGERVYRRDNPSRGLTYAQAATRAIALGGRFDGHELPDDIHAITKTSATALAGLGLMGVAKDNYPRDGDTYSFVVGFAEVEVDVETGNLELAGLSGRRRRRHGRSTREACTVSCSAACCLGIGHALMQKWVYDQHYGVPLAKRFHHDQAADDPRHPAHDADARRSASRIRRRRSAHAASASRRSAPATAPC